MNEGNRNWPRAQYFEPYGKCNRCRIKRIEGVIKSYINEDMGGFCTRCANKIIKDTHSKGEFHPDMCYDKGK